MDHWRSSAIFTDFLFGGKLEAKIYGKSTPSQKKGSDFWPVVHKLHNLGSPRDWNQLCPAQPCRTGRGTHLWCCVSYPLALFFDYCMCWVFQKSYNVIYEVLTELKINFRISSWGSIVLYEVQDKAFFWRPPNCDAVAFEGWEGISFGELASPVIIWWRPGQTTSKQWRFFSFLYWQLYKPFLFVKIIHRTLRCHVFTI